MTEILISAVGWFRTQQPLDQQTSMLPLSYHRSLLLLIMYLTVLLDRTQFVIIVYLKYLMIYELLFYAFLN